MNRKIKILVDDKEIDYYEFADEVRNGDYFFKENGEWYLYKRPTIIEEDKKIEKIYEDNDDFKNDKRLYRPTKNIEVLANKINEIIDYLNKEKEND